MKLCDTASCADPIEARSDERVDENGETPYFRNANQHPVQRALIGSAPPRATPAGALFAFRRPISDTRPAHKARFAPNSRERLFPTVSFKMCAPQAKRKINCVFYLNRYDEPALS